MSGVRSGNTRFKQGHRPWNKDLKGIHLSPHSEFKKGTAPRNKKEWIKKTCACCGKSFSVKPSLDRVRCCSRGCAVRGRPSPWKGRSPSPEARAKMRAAKIGIRGEDHPLYRGADRTERSRAMARDEYKQWRLAVFCRDDFTCCRCGQRGGGHLHAHHIQGWTKHPELRFDVSNGQTLCVPCHFIAHGKRPPKKYRKEAI